MTSDMLNTQYQLLIACVREEISIEAVKLYTMYFET